MKIIESSEDKTYEFFEIYKNEKELISALKRGEESAYRRLYKFFAPRIALLARSYRLYEHTDDIIQEVILRVYKHIRKFKGDCHLITWVYRIAINVCNDTIKKTKKRETNIELEFGDEDKTYQFATEESFEENYFSEIDEEILRKAIDRLNESEKVLLFLKEVEELTYDELAKIFNIPAGTVKSRLHYTKEKLKKLLGDQSTR